MNDLNSRNKMFVADSTPLGQAGRDAGLTASQVEFYKSLEEEKNANSERIGQRIKIKHHGEVVDIVAEKEYGNRETSRRFEKLPKIHLLMELREVLKYGAFPKYQYNKNEFNLVSLIDSKSFNRKRAAEYYYTRCAELINLDELITIMIDGYARALDAMIFDYEKDVNGNSIYIGDLLMRNLVDQVHRRTRRDVECGLQLNTIEDPELITEESGCLDAIALLYRSYERIEDIEGSLAKYIPFNGEIYVSPSELPMTLDDKKNAFIDEYEQETKEVFSKFFDDFDPESSQNFDYMTNFFIQIRNILLEVDTGYGSGFSPFYEDLDLRKAGIHIKQAVDAINNIRKKGNLLAALAYCVELAWNEAPELQTATAWLIYKHNAGMMMQYYTNGWSTSQMPDVEPMLEDEKVLSDIFINNPDPVEVFQTTIDVFKHSRIIMEKMEKEYDRGHLPMWNFKRRKWQDGQLIEPGAAKDGSDLRYTVDQAYELSEDISREKHEDLISALKGI